MAETNKMGNKIVLSDEDKDDVISQVLTEDSELYKLKNDDERDTKKTWKELDKKEKWQFFKDYYLIKCVLALIGVAFAIYVGVVTLGPHTERVFYLAIIEDTLDNDAVDTMESDLDSLLDVGKHEEVYIDTSFNFNDSNSSYSGSDKLTTIMYSKLVDGIVSDTAQFQDYAYYGYLKNLDEFLPDDMKEALSDYLITGYFNYDDDEVDGETTEEMLANDDTVETYTCGIDLSKCEKYQELDPYMEDPILSIAYNAPNEDNIIKVLKYLFDLE